jgi:ABC-type uncharacterized transport system involved in gliding motility auxiliary subunit
MRQKSLSGITSGLLVLGIVVLINIVSMNLFGRVDLTAGKIFSLNGASKRLVSQLEDDYLVKAYFSKDLPAPYNANAKYVQDLMQEYKAYGKGHFRFEFVDPTDDAELEQEAQQHRIPPVQVQVVEKDQFQSRKAYMGLVFLYQGRQETIPVVENLVGLEYEMTATMKKLTSNRETLPVIGFLGGHQEPELAQLQIIQQVFAKQYQLRAVNVADGSSMPRPRRRSCSSTPMAVGRNCRICRPDSLHATRASGSAASCHNATSSRHREPAGWTKSSDPIGR